MLLCKADTVRKCADFFVYHVYVGYIGYTLAKHFFLSGFQSSRVHITRAVLEQFLSFAKYLDGLPHGAPLLKQLCDHVLFNPAIWIHTPAKVCSFFSHCVFVWFCVL